MMQLKFVDYFQIAPDKKLTSLDSGEKVKFIDKILDNDSESKGLLVTFDLSHSGRRINNRIYPVRGQQNGIKTLLQPYPKPILLHHRVGGVFQEAADPIGRFVSGEWQDTSENASKFFRNIKDFVALRGAFEDNDPKTIYEMLHKKHLLTNPKWPGMGRMRVTARISDKDAIEKFLDSRYLTFSAGSTSDKYVCGICLQDWAQKDFCDHQPGMLYDGKPCVMITGDFMVQEGSVVNAPADEMAQVISIQVTDSVDSATVTKFPLETNMVDSDTMYLSDSAFNIETITDEPTTASILEAVVVDSNIETLEAETIVEPEVLVENNNMIDTETEVETPLSINSLSLEDIIAELVKRGFVQTTELSSTTLTVEHTVDSIDTETTVNVELEALQKDYENALVLLAEARKQATESLEVLAKIYKKDFSEISDAEKLAKMYEWSITIADNNCILNLNTRIENPSVAGSEQVTDDPKQIKQLGPYEEKVVKQFKEIFDAQGENKANKYLATQRAYLSRGFDPKKFISED